MDKRPIRRKFKDNPYRLDSIEKKEIYIINFIDSRGHHQSIQVNKKIFDVFDEEERYENATIKEYAIHKSYKRLKEELISNKYSLEEEVINNHIIKQLKKLINILPDIQKRRLIKYFFHNKTYEDIAKEEHCTKRAVKFSIDIALEKISKNFQK